MACANDAQPLQLPWKNISISADGYGLARGISLEIGTPPQFFALKPATYTNNTYVDNIIDCGTASNLSCTAGFGGVFDSSKSTSFERTVQSQWNGTQGYDVDQDGPYIFFNDDLLVGTNGSIAGFPLITDATGGTSRPSNMGLGQGSTFLKSVVANAIAPSSIWSLWTGIRAVGNSVDGLLVVGGYDEGRIGGDLKTFTSYPGCPLLIDITDVSYDTVNGSTTLFKNSTVPIYACLDPSYNGLELPQVAWNKFANASGGTYNSSLELLTYPASSPPTGNMTITLYNGYKTVVPASELFSVLKHWDSKGNYLPVDDSPVVSEVTNYTSDTYAATIGFPYMTMNYFIVNYDSAEFHMAPAIRDNFINNDQAQSIVRACTAPPAPPPSASPTHTPLPPSPVSSHSSTPTPTPHPSHTGAIVGGAVGGVLGLALIAALLFFFFLRRDRKNRGGQAAAPAALVEDREVASYRGKPAMSVTTDTAHTEVSELASPHQHVSQWLSTHPGDDPHDSRMYATSGPVEMPVSHH